MDASSTMATGALCTVTVVAKSNLGSVFTVVWGLKSFSYISILIQFNGLNQSDFHSHSRNCFMFDSQFHCYFVNVAVDSYKMSVYL